MNSANSRKDRNAAKPATEKSQSGGAVMGKNEKSVSGNLVGKFFHSFKDAGEMEWQGRVLSEPKPGIFLVQTYSFATGAEYDQRLIPVERMVNWRFYGTDAAWREVSEGYQRQQRMMIRRKAMKLNLLSISGPCEPGVYAVCRIELSFDDQNSLTIDKLLVVQNKQGGLSVSIPRAIEDDAYGRVPSYTLSPNLARLVARAVLDEYGAWAKQHDYIKPQWAPPSDSSEWCIPADQCVDQHGDGNA
jgi:hypothetical protein